MRDQIELLEELRRVDSGMERLRTRIRALESEIQRSLAEESLQMAALTREKSKLEATQHRRREAELEVRARADLKVRTDQRLREVKTNPEYQAVLREIAAVESQISGLEDTILAAMEEEEAGQARVAQLEQDVAGRRGKAAADRQQLEQQRSVAEQRIGELTAGRAAVVERLAPQIRSRYERLRTAKGDHVIAAVIGGACGGCHYHLTPQVVNVVRQGEQLVYCEACGRMLVFPREADTDLL